MGEPEIKHPRCKWTHMVAYRLDGPCTAGHLRCPACGQEVAATPEQVAQAVAADAAYEARLALEKKGGGHG